MNPLLKAAAAAGGEWLLGKLANSPQVEKMLAKGEENRCNTPFYFDEKIPEQDFRNLVIKSTKKIKQISDIQFDGPVVLFTVGSQNGIPDWDFEIDFNDYGQLTGSWWMTFRGNDDSSIPDRAADLISDAIEEMLDEYC